MKTYGLTDCAIGRGIAVAAMAMLSACTSLHDASSRGVSPSLRVGTYNIRLMPGDNGTPNAWDERKGDLVEEIRRLDMDVFGMQEVFPEQAFFITNSLPQYAVVGEYRESDRVSGEASPVCYRKDRFEVLSSGTFWLSETPDVPGVRGWGAACPRVCSWALLKDRWSGATLTFANTHTDHVSKLARKEGMQLIIRRMREFAPKGTPIVFTGDHNCLEMDAPAKAVREILNDSLYASATPPAGPWRTFNGWKWREREESVAEALGRPAADRGSRGDYIYVSKDVKVTSYAVHADPRQGQELYPSDHFPITADIVLP